MRHSLPVRPRMLLCLGLGLAATPVLASGHEPLLEAAAAKLKLTEVRIFEKGSHMPDLHGRLPDGSEVEVDVRRDGSIEEIETESRGGFSPDSIAVLLHPDMLTGAPWGPDARFYKVEFDEDGEIEIEGIDGKSRRFEADYGRGGRLSEFKYDD
ncbi:hypothetical protein [Pseudooceanicola nanhaiensis]|uniref:hypothetical protein n=1 Tax=Pseudooceanicola nanhaiensis TaxID=375761 RepID=UPI001CD4190F|nr:hypothetical protein [Pseudooceanicola nanhaiensis]MCA0920915.1 hypothetical protein [Pseudooceanicola nanhaiensis]